MAKTNFKNFVLKKDATGSFESVKQKRGHGDGVVNPRRKKRKSLDERITEAVAKALVPVVADIKDIKGILKRNNLS